MADDDSLSDEDRARAVQALNLKLAGVDWHTIANKLNYADAVDAIEAASEVADTQYDGLPIDHQRLLEVLRLDRLQAAVWPHAMKGDLNAVDRALTISDRRARYLRLNQRSEG